MGGGVWIGAEVERVVVIARKGQPSRRAIAVLERSTDLLNPDLIGDELSDDVQHHPVCHLGPVDAQFITGFPYCQACDEYMDSDL